MKGYLRQIFYFLEHKKYIVLPTLFIFGFSLAFIGFVFIEDKHFYESFTSSLQMLILNLPTDYKYSNIFLFLSSLLIAFAIFYAVITTFFKSLIDKIVLAGIKKQENYTVVFGLGDINRGFLDEKYIQDAIIYEKDETNPYIDEYRKKGFGIAIKDVLSSEFKDDDFSNMKYAIIALGDDLLNIDFSIKLMKHLKTKGISKEKRVVIYIKDEELRKIFTQNILPSIELSDLKHLDIKIFSYFEEAVNTLFEKHSFISDKDIKGNDEIKTVILGNANLASKLVKELLVLSNLPNKNRHKIYLISEDAQNFAKYIKTKTFYSKEKFPTVEILSEDKSFKTLDFFSSILEDDDLSNIYICYDDDKINLNIAIELNDKILIKKDTNKTKLYLAICKDYQFIKDNKFLGKFIVFGQEKEILTKSNIIDEENYTIAKMIHYGYGNSFDNTKFLEVKKDELNSKWFEIKNFDDKLSNISQAKHINIKLQALGLQKEKSDERKEDLFKNNKQIFDEVIMPKLKEAKLSYELLQEASNELDKFHNQEAYEVKYFPKNFEDTYFDRLINAEHERWNSYHYVNSWEYKAKKDKAKKYHNCLKNLKDFKEKDLQISILYDIYSILYIPNYLANAGYKISKK